MSPARGPSIIDRKPNRQDGDTNVHRLYVGYGLPYRCDSMRGFEASISESSRLMRLRRSKCAFI